MDKLEKVIEGLDNCICGLCDLCPYYGEKPCEDAMKRDALYLLKEHGPRLLSLDEAIAWSKKTVIERDPIFVEMRPDPTAVPNYWTLCTIFDTESCEARAMYNKVLRFWTGRPTLEQMQEAKWDD